MYNESIFKRIQEEQKPWVLHNFGDRPSWMPILGVVEELGELVSSNSIEQIKDAIGDISIFMSDFCNARGYDIDNILIECPQEKSVLPLNSGMMIELGKIAHSFLKESQKIRKQDYSAKEKQAISNLIGYLDRYCILDNLSLKDIIEETWHEVKQRDWKKFPKNGKTE